MRVGICTDVHLHVGRLHRFAAQARDHGAQELWCLGDVVDALLGAPPKAHAAAINAALQLCDVVLAGNHDLWALQRGQLDELTAKRVRDWSAVERRHGVGLVHASLDDPFMEFVRDEESAGRLLRQSDCWLAVHGHTHVRKLWAQIDDFPFAVSRPTRGTVHAGDERLLACPGAITGGRPTWLLADLEARTLRWIALPPDPRPVAEPML